MRKQDNCSRVKLRSRSFKIAMIGVSRRADDEAFWNNLYKTLDFHTSVSDIH